jgi:hypothetical protein
MKINLKDVFTEEESYGVKKKMAGGCLCVAFVSRRLASLFLIRIIITRLTVCP